MRSRDRENRMLWLSQNKYLIYVLQKFHMSHCRLLNVFISIGPKLLVQHCSSTTINMEDIDSISCARAIGSLAYIVVCTRLDIVEVVEDFSPIMAILEHSH